MTNNPPADTIVLSICVLCCKLTIKNNINYFVLFSFFRKSADELNITITCGIKSRRLFLNLYILFGSFAAQCFLRWFSLEVENMEETSSSLTGTNLPLIGMGYGFLRGQQLPLLDRILSRLKIIFSGSASEELKPFL